MIRLPRSIALLLALALALCSHGCATAPRLDDPTAPAIPLPPAPIALAPAAPDGRRAPLDPMAACTAPGAEIRATARAPRPLSAREERVVEVYERRARGGVEPAEGPTLAEAEFARANALFDARHWTEATPALRALLFDRPEGTPAATAVRYLEALNMLGSYASRPACFDVMIVDIGPLNAQLCVGTRETANRVECRVLERVAFDIERLEVERLVANADHGKGDPLASYAEAGERYLDLAVRCVATTRRLAEAPTAWACDEVAYSAARAFRAATRLDRAAIARELLLDPGNGMRASPLAKRLASE